MRSNLPTPTPESTPEAGPVMLKVALVWLATVTGLTLSEWATVLAIAYTLLQLVITLRDRVWRDWWERRQHRRAGPRPPPG